MAGNLQKTLDRLRSKIAILMERYALLEKAKEDAEGQIKELVVERDNQKKIIEQLQREVEYLRIATTITPDRKDVERSRAMLSGLVREIDKCITELTE